VYEVTIRVAERVRNGVDVVDCWLLTLGDSKANTETTKIRPVTKATLGATEMNHPADRLCDISAENVCHKD
jgi:hypothetical protein